MVGAAAQTGQVSYDWVGQYGYWVDQGAVVWNQDWSVGSLIMDGTFTPYPQRYGQAVSQRWRPQNGGVLQLEHLSLDSAGVHSRFVNDRGDYFLDNLEVVLDFSIPQRRLQLTGFKRVYAGPFNQYTASTLSPLQQSYLIDYVGATTNDTLAVTIGKFLTNSGLPDTSANPAYLKDDIFAGGFSWTHQGPFGQITTSASPFFQRYRGTSSLADGSFAFQLARTTVTQNWDWKREGWMSGISWEWTQWGREVAPDTLLSSSRWTVWGTVFTSTSKQIELGTSVLDRQSALIYRLRWSSKWGSLKQMIQLSSDVRPGVDFSSHSSLYQRWTRAGYTLSYLRDWITIAYATQVTLVDGLPSPLIWNGLFPGILPGSWEQSAQMTLRPHRAFTLDTRWVHYSPTSDLGPGYEDRFSQNIESHLRLFHDRMAVTIDLEINGYLHRRSQIEFNPVLAALQSSSGRLTPVRDPLWVTNLSIHAQISSVTISWSFNNAMMLVSGQTSDYLISWYDGFQPKGRLSRFTIDWRFND